jgi:hypothetical protein
MITTVFATCCVVVLCVLCLCSKHPQRSDPLVVMQVHISSQMLPAPAGSRFRCSTFPILYEKVILRYSCVSLDLEKRAKEVCNEVAVAPSACEFSSNPPLIHITKSRFREVPDLTSVDHVQAHTFTCFSCEGSCLCVHCNHNGAQHSEIRILA